MGGIISGLHYEGHKAPAESAAAPPAVQVSVTSSGIAAVGDRDTAAGVGGMAVGGDVHCDISITGRSRTDYSEEN